MSAFNEPPQARRRNGRPWPVVRRQRHLQGLQRAAEALREEVLFLAIRTGPKPPEGHGDGFNPYQEGRS